MSIRNENLILPPRIDPKVSTKYNFDLTIESIIWKTSKVYANVKVHLLFWGQNEGIYCEGIRIDRNNKQSLKTLHYQVKTNARLFIAYLNNCEPIKINIYSSKTSDLIGTSEFNIPMKFLNLKSIDEQQSCKTSAKICSSRSFELGEITVSMTVQQSDSMTQKSFASKFKESRSIKTVKTTTSIKEKSSLPSVLRDKCTNKGSLEIVGKKKRISFRDPKPVKPSTLVKHPEKENPVNFPRSIIKRPSLTSSSSSDTKSSLLTSPVDVTDKTPLINYLSGEQMTRDEERNVLQHLGTNSPTAQAIEALNEAQPVKQKPHIVKSKPDNKINSIRIKVEQIQLNAAGQLEAQSLMNKNSQKFIIKCVVTSKVFKSKDDHRLISPFFETAPKSK